LLKKKIIKANKIKFKYADIFYKRGKIFYYLKRFNEAILDFSRAIELEPQKTKYYEKRAAVYYELKKYDKIVSDYTSLLKLEPQNIVYYAKRAKALVLEKGKSIRNEYKIISKESYDKDEESVQTFYDEDNNIIMNVVRIIWEFPFRTISTQVFTKAKVLSLYIPATFFSLVITTITNTSCPRITMISITSHQSLTRI